MLRRSADDIKSGLCYLVGNGTAVNGENDCLFEEKLSVDRPDTGSGSGPERYVFLLQ